MNSEGGVKITVNRVYAKSRTAQADVLLEIIRSANREISRQEIAEALGKRRLNKWDIALLDFLVAEGSIVVRRREHSAGTLLEYIYRAAN